MCLHLFQLSLRYQASNWLKRLLAGSVTTWEDLTTHFHAQFFPPRRTAKLRNDILMFQQHHGESLSEAWTHFKDLLQKVPHHGIDLWLQDLALYDNESWNGLRDFAKPVKAIALPQDSLINKVNTSCEICSGPYDTQYCMKDNEQAFVEYASLRTDEVGGKRFTPNQGPRNFNDAADTWKDKPNFNWGRTQTFTSPKNGLISTHSSSYQIKLKKALLDFDSHQERRLSHLRTQLKQKHDDMIGKINLLWKTITEKLNDVSTPENAGNSMAPKSIATISQVEREELKNKEIKSLSKLFSLKYLSPVSIKELNKNLSAPKRVHFVNSIVVLSKDSDTKEKDVSSTNTREHDLEVW
ncbi:MAK10-like protein [Tanacetum coccineum]